MSGGHCFTVIHTPPSPHLCLCCWQNVADVHLANGCALSFVISPHCECALARIGPQHFLKEVEEVTQYHCRRDVVMFVLLAGTGFYLEMHRTKNSWFVFCVFVAVFSICVMLCDTAGVWDGCLTSEQWLWILSFCMMSIVFLQVSHGLTSVQTRECFKKEK